MSPVAQDGVTRDYSSDATVHRDFIVVDPPMQGRDVANYQRALRDRLKSRGLLDDVPVPTHGKFTYATWVAAVEVGYFLGLRSDTYLAQVQVKGERRGRVTEGAQTIARNPDQRDAGQLSRAKSRQGQLDEGPRYYDDLAKKANAHPVVAKGPQAALAYLQKHVGTTEHPAGSNWGPWIEDIIKLAGYDGPVYWCGCATNAGLVAAGIPNGAGWIGFCPAVVAHAKAGTGGWSWHTEGEPGDIILFAGPDGIPEHQGLVRSRVGEGHYLSVEGNTSPPNSSGSQANGGGLWNKERTSTPNFKIVGFARPPW